MVERLDTYIAPTLKSELLLISGKGEKNIILDLCNCKYCDASGFAAVLVGNRLCHNSGGVFVISGLNGAFKELITISQLDSVLNITDSVQQAEILINLTN